MAEHTAGLGRSIIQAVLILAVAGSARAQLRPGAVTGIVKDSGGKAIAGVEVTALKAGKTARTDSAGEFTIANIGPGPADLSVRRLAFAPAIVSVEIPPGDTTEVEITLSVAAQRLTAVVVQAHPDQLRELYAFELRRRQGIGHFITRRQIEERHPLLLSDMARLIPGVAIVSDNGRNILRFSRVGRNNCPPQFFVDGVPVTGFSIDDMPAGDVEGVELYAGSAGMPPEFNRARSTVICGAVIIWTRIPGTARAKP